MRLIAEEEETVSSASTQSTKAPTRNAFESMMMSQRALSFQSQLPARIDAPRNKKDEMFNELVSLFEEQNLKWNGGSSHGKNFVFGLRDTLWYIDGHHSTLEERTCPIPKPLSKFVGYNIPERSKHRKHQWSNLSYDTLVKHVTVLRESLLTSWMQQSKWKALKESVCLLATVIDDYCMYLRERCKATKASHASEEVIDSSSDSGTVIVLPVVTLVSWRLKELNRVIQEKPCYETIAVNDYCSVDPKIKYQFMQDLRKGLSTPAILYTCSLGSNLGNYNFVWRIPSGVKAGL